MADQQDVVYFLCHPHGHILVHTVAANRDKCWELGIYDIFPARPARLRNTKTKHFARLMDSAIKNGWCTVAYKILPNDTQIRASTNG